MEQLKLEQVDIGYGGQPLIQKIDLSFLQGKMTCILGSNGAGKTTLLKTIARIIKPLGGVIRFGGEDVRQINGVRYAKEVSAVLTDRISLENCTVWDVAAMGRNPHTGFFGLLAEEDRRRVRESLEACDAWELRNRLFNQLSDGQKQKVLIARGLVRAHRYCCWTSLPAIWTSFIRWKCCKHCEPSASRREKQLSAPCTSRILRSNAATGWSWSKVIEFWHAATRETLSRAAP